MRGVLMLALVLSAWVSMAWFALPGQESPERPELVGTVVDEGGRPVAGIRVGCNWRHHKGEYFPLLGGVSDSSGNFRVPLIGSAVGNRVALMGIDLEGERAGSVTFAPERAGAALTIRLGPLAWIRGKVSCPELGEGPRRYHVTVYHSPVGDYAIAGEFTDESFELPLALGRYHVEFHSCEFEQTVWKWDLTAETRDEPHREISIKPGVLARHFDREPPEWNATHGQGAPDGLKAGDSKGRWLLVAFWRQEALQPALDAFRLLHLVYTDFKDLRRRFAVVGFHVGAGASLEEPLARLDQADFGVIRGGPPVRGRDLPFTLLHDASGRTRSAYQVGERVRYMLLDPEGRVVRGGSVGLLEQILEGVRKEGRRAGEFLARLKTEKNPRRAVALIAEIAQEGGEGAARALIEYGGEVRDRAGQLAVVEGLGRIGWRGASAFLLGERGLGARDRGLRLAAATALSSAGDATAVPALIEILAAKTPEPDLVGAACAALCRLAPADPAVREAVLELVGNRNAACRAHALEALVDLGCPEVGAHLTQALAEDASAAVRLKAVQLLARIKAKDAVGLLRKTAEEDRSPLVRKAAEAALEEMEAGG